MKENAMTMNFEPQEYVTFAQTTKFGTHEYKAFHSILHFTFCTLLFAVIYCLLMLYE